jgi:hypothetical protein|tara:strand:- start:1668 stop:1865 length:198 start_codon:yes stop_codon:yes gene_type:complete
LQRQHIQLLLSKIGGVLLLLLLVLQNLVFVILKQSLEVSDFDRFDPTKGRVSAAVELNHRPVAFS